MDCYRILANGLKIQWQNNTASGWDRTINLTSLGLLSFTSATSYVVTMTFDWGTGGQNGYDKSTRVYGKTASSFKTWVDGAGKVSWIAIGY